MFPYTVPNNIVCKKVQSKIKFLCIEMKLFVLPKVANYELQ